MRRLMLLTTSVFAMLAGPATAQTSLMSLHDITLQIFWIPQAEGKTAGSVCSKDGQSTMRFVVEGSPDGTNGTVKLREEGTVRVGPQELPAIPEDETHWNGTYFLNAGPVVEWESEFTIDARAYNGTTVVGTRSGTEPVAYDVAVCREFNGPADADVGHNNTVGYTHYARAIRLAYEATMTNAGKTTAERGMSEVNLRESFLNGDPGSRVGQYRTTFAADGEAPVAEPTSAPEGTAVTTDEEPNGGGPGGDGATQADPVEVTLDDGEAVDTTLGEVSTGARAVAAARKRLRLVGAQRVRVRAPRRAAPVRMTFEIDSAARRSAGPRKLVVQRSGKTVKACASGASPCVEKRSLSGGDDARIVVRGAALAGTWSVLAPRR